MKLMNSNAQGPSAPAASFPAHPSDPQTSTLTSTQIRPEVPQMKSLSPEWGNPTADNILSRLKKADDPVAFINANLKPKDNPVNPQQVSDQIAENRPLGPEALAKNPPPPDPNPEIPPEEPPGSIQENYKKLRSQYKETKEQFRSVEDERNQLKTRVEALETGNATPEAIQKLHTRIQELEPLEALVDLKKSKAYQTKYIQPLNELNSKLSTIAKDYEIPEVIMQEAAQITNRAELNRFLLNHFDEVGVLEVKQIIGDVQLLQKSAKQAESEPQKALENLSKEWEGIQQIKQQERRSQIADKSTAAWEKSVHALRKEGRVQEIIPRTNDPEFNETWVKPIMERASMEYGAVIRTLAENGLESLPDELAEALATSCLLSITSAVSVERANAAEDYANQVHQNSQRTNGMVRPSMGQSGSMGAPHTSNQSTRPDSPLAAGRAIINKVLSNTR